jgi:hypothetical protein
MSEKRRDASIALMANSFDEILTRLNPLVDGCFQNRFSSFYGGLYYYLPGIEEISITKNLDDREIAEVDFAEYPYLFIVDNTNRLDFWIDALSEFRAAIIRSSEY